MHEIGTLIWVVLVIVGVISSMIATARKPASQVRRAGVSPAAPPPRPSAQARFAPESRPAAPRTEPESQPKTPRAVGDAPDGGTIGAPRERAPRGSLFRDRAAVRRGIVAAEVLGKPLALRDE